MKRLYKKHKLNFLGFTISVRITYSNKREYNFSKLFSPALAFLTILLFAYFISSTFSNPAYATVSSPFMAKISPVLADYAENNIPTPPKNDDSVVFHGPIDSKQIALTFDADMTPTMKNFLSNGEVPTYYNKQVIDVLRSTKTKATLFLSGMWIEIYPQVTRELANDSLLELGNHSYSHPSFSGTCFGLLLTQDSQKSSEVSKTQKLLSENGSINSNIFRFPGGCYSTSDLKYIQKEGLRVIHWDVAGQDGFNKDATSIENNVINHVKNGSIIVLHMNGAPNSPKTAEALPKIISTLKERGFIFVKISELLRPKNIQAMNIRDFLNHEYGL